MATRRARTKTTTKSTPELIAHKRDGGAFSDVEIAHLIEGYVSGAVTDYQMSSLAMAIFFRGMTPKETAALTLAMRDSGEVVDLSSIKQPKVDKHSTGGVGDKISICLAPMVAACGVPVPMISGRGLGHTGGTLDKLEAIPGFSVDTTTKGFIKEVKQIGCSLIGQTADLAPADKRLYALRDVTATVESIPLITASILSKKLAEGIDALVLDVKVGRGAFMKTEKDARALASSLVRVGRLAKKKVTAILTRMDDPLGHAIGNSLETIEAFEVLMGGGPDDVREITLALGAEMLRMGGVAKNESQARKQLLASIADGSAIRKMEEIVKYQGGDPRAVTEHDRMPKAPKKSKVKAKRAGVVTEIDALEIGLASVGLGAGRSRADQAVDPAVGIMLEKKPGDRVKVGDTIATLHVRETKDAKAARSRVAGAFTIKGRGKKLPPLVIDVIRR